MHLTGDDQDGCLMSDPDLSLHGVIHWTCWDNYEQNFLKKETKTMKYFVTWEIVNASHPQGRRWLGMEVDFNTPQNAVNYCYKFLRNNVQLQVSTPKEMWVHSLEKTTDLPYALGPYTESKTLEYSVIIQEEPTKELALHKTGKCKDVKYTDADEKLTIEIFKKV